MLAPIGVERFALRRTLEPDGAQGIPILAYGAMPTLDKAAKIALLLEHESVYPR